MSERGEAVPTPAGAPTIDLPESFWRDASLSLPDTARKASVHLRVDPDVLAWFRSQGRGHLTRMNAVLRAYYLAMRRPAK